MQNKGALKDKGKGKSERSVKPKDSNSAGKWDLLSARQNGDNEEEHVSYAHSSEGQARKALVDNKSKPSGKGAKREKSRGPSKYGPRNIRWKKMARTSKVVEDKMEP